jgi:hypothetical protein
VFRIFQFTMRGPWFQSTMLVFFCSSGSHFGYEKLLKSCSLAEVVQEIRIQYFKKNSCIFTLKLITVQYNEVFFPTAQYIKSFLAISKILRTYRKVLRDIYLKFLSNISVDFQIIFETTVDHDSEPLVYLQSIIKL